MKRINLRTLVTIALLVAINIVLTRIFVIYITDFARLDLGNVPLLLSGLLFGPVAGALTGGVADVMGALISGRGWFPPLTFGPILMGLIPGLLGLWYRKSPTLTKIVFIIVLGEFFASVLWKTYWLSVLYGISYFACLMARLPAIIPLTIVEIILVYILYRRLVKEF
ncbi:MAG: folate family ECF transporter S component [Anaerovoracaceae bacterium]|jgi:ECF transporter S component (folate family)